MRTFRVLPFAEHMFFGDGVPAKEVVGRIEGDRFVVSVFAVDVSLPIREVGVDDKGRPFAIIDAKFEHRLPAKYRLRTGLEYDEPDEEGFAMSPTGEVEIWLEGRYRQAAREAIRRQGGDADKAITSLPPSTRSRGVSDDVTDPSVELVSGFKSVAAEMERRTRLTSPVLGRLALFGGGCRSHRLAADASDGMLPSAPMPLVLPPTAADLAEPSTRPYFLWWTDATVRDLRGHLASSDPEERAYWTAALLREANTRDVWLFVTPDEVRGQWDRLQRYLGRGRELWAYLLGRETRTWPPEAARRV